MIKPKIHIISLFPEFFRSPLQASLLGKACKDSALVDIELHQLRDFAVDSYGKVDDMPYGGGSGMLLMPGPIDDAVQAIKERGKTYVVLLSATGKLWSHKLAFDLSQKFFSSSLTFICGHYEGIDYRVTQHIADTSISIGDYVVSSGEVATLVVLESIVRLLPGFMSNVECIKDDSFVIENYLEYPQYTRPRNYKGHKVPPVLLSGNHQKIKKWHQEQSNQRDC